ncbi:hypothetical protein ACFWXM_29705, partial [Achromobacter xylosoxidans]|uniref:hypothetical protein n=1 Tax=Alcaligenes xylosoxydans xylosoxydans TaxID=85698 RepID=UPI0037602917
CVGGNTPVSALMLNPVTSSATSADPSNNLARAVAPTLMEILRGVSHLAAAPSVIDGALSGRRSTGTVAAVSLEAFKFWNAYEIASLPAAVCSRPVQVANAYKIP